MRNKSIPFAFACSLLCASAYVPAVLSASLDQSLDEVEKTHQTGASSQKKIDKLSAETRALLDEYKKLVHNAEYQDTYNKELQRLKLEQESLIDSLNKQINDIKQTQQRIMPLMHSMADTLQQFILLDIPFKHEQRLSEVVVLKQQLESAKLTVPEKFRAVWESYQAETDYGHSIETYRGNLKTGGKERSVEFLRIGRIALYYLTLDGEESGYWDVNAKSWKKLNSGYNDSIRRGIRVAGKQMAPTLLELPLLASKKSGEGN